MWCIWLKEKNYFFFLYKKQKYLFLGKERKVFLIDNPLKGKFILSNYKSKKEGKDKFSRVANITFDITDKCNMDCIYCYAYTKKKKKIMKFETARLMIDFMQNNKDYDSLSISFTGSGEPTLAFNLIKKIVNYAKKGKKPVKVYLANTNASLLKKEDIKWLAKNNSGSITVSFEVLEDIQNFQRPFKGNKPSFKKVMETLKLFDKFNLEYGIRVTLTKKNYKKIIDCIKFIKENLKCRLIKIDPVSISGKAKKNPQLKVTMMQYAKEAQKAYEFAKKNGIHLVIVSMAQRRKNEFCKALEPNSFTINSSNSIISCPAYAFDDNPKSNPFLFGKIDLKNKKVIFDKNKIINLNKKRVESLKKCNKCSYNLFCFGGCPKIDYSHKTKKFIPPTKSYCSARKKLIRYMLVNNRID